MGSLLLRRAGHLVHKKSGHPSEIRFLVRKHSPPNLEQLKRCKWNCKHFDSHLFIDAHSVSERFRVRDKFQLNTDTSTKQKTTKCIPLVAAIRITNRKYKSRCKQYVTEQRKFSVHL